MFCRTFSFFFVSFFIHLTRTLKNSHFTWIIYFYFFLVPILFFLLTCSLYFPPLLNVPSLLTELHSPLQSTQIPFFCPGCFSCCEKGAEGAQQQRLKALIMHLLGYSLVASFVVSKENNRGTPLRQLLESLHSLIFVCVDTSFQQRAKPVIYLSPQESTVLEIYYTSVFTNIPTRAWGMGTHTPTHIHTDTYQVNMLVS